MKPLGPELEHYWLVLGMAKATGVDLDQKFTDGTVSQSEWAETVQRCRGCQWATECKGWLRENETTEAAPSPCVNADLFARLKEDDAPSIAAE